MGLEVLASLKGMRAPAGIGSRISTFWKQRIATNIQVVGPEGAGVTSYILQLVQPGILDDNTMAHYNGGKTFDTKVQCRGVIRKLKLRDVLVEDEEKRFVRLCSDFTERKPVVVIWIAPGKPEILKDKEDRPEYELFRRYVQFLMADKYALPDGTMKKKKRPKALIVQVNHMDEYERLWQVNFFDFLEYYRKPLAYIRKDYKKVRVITQPCCAWGNIGIREPLMDVLMDLDVEKV